MLLFLTFSVILFIVYAAFCESVKSRVWEKYGLTLTIEVLAVVIFLFTVISLLAAFALHTKLGAGFKGKALTFSSRYT